MTPSDSPPATEYATWSAVRQRRHLTELVGTVLARYPIEVGSVRLVQMGFNATFRVEGTIDDTVGRWAVRLNAQGLRSAAETAAELAWVAALGEHSEVRVPRVVRSTDGLPMVAVPSESLARHVTGVMFEWLPGRLLQEEPRPVELRRLGRIMAQLHQHGETWTPPAGASLPRIDDPRMGLADHLANHPLLDATQRSIVGEVVARATSAFTALGARAPHVVHGDLHPGNLMTAGGTLAVLDFDDCGLSHPLHDLAITAYHLRPAPHEEPLFDGYRSVRPLPEHTREQFESLVASRNVALLNDTVTVDAAWVRDLLPTYIPNTITKLRNYLDTGVYRHDVDGLI
jgi:Ser/Thr protein kinase RdoA (MazF antagonist)